MTWPVRVCPSSASSQLGRRPKSATLGVPSLSNSTLDELEVAVDDPREVHAAWIARDSGRRVCAAAIGVIEAIASLALSVPPSSNSSEK